MRYYEDPPEFCEPTTAVASLPSAFRSPAAGERPALVDPPEFVALSEAWAPDARVQDHPAARPRTMSVFALDRWRRPPPPSPRRRPRPVSDRKTRRYR
jgi:hypothetical protein